MIHHNHCAREGLPPPLTTGKLTLVALLGNSPTNRCWYSNLCLLESYSPHSTSASSLRVIVKQNVRGHQWILSSWKEMHKIPVCVLNCVLCTIRLLDKNGFLIHPSLLAWPQVNSVSLSKFIIPFRVPISDAQARIPGVILNLSLFLKPHMSSGTKYHGFYLCQLEECLWKQQGRGPIQLKFHTWHLWKEVWGGSLVGAS